jgi:hypothetical protein
VIGAVSNRFGGPGDAAILCATPDGVTLPK